MLKIWRNLICITYTCSTWVILGSFLRYKMQVTEKRYFMDIFLCFSWFVTTGYAIYTRNFIHLRGTAKLEDHWSCIAHLSAEDMLKSAVIEEKKFKHSPRVGVNNPLGPKFWCQQEGLITVVICCKFKKYLFNLWLYTHLFMI